MVEVHEPGRLVDDILLRRFEHRGTQLEPAHLVRGERRALGLLGLGALELHERLGNGGDIDLDRDRLDLESAVAHVAHQFLRDVAAHGRAVELGLDAQPRALAVDDAHLSAAREVGTGAAVGIVGLLLRRIPERGGPGALDLAHPRVSEALGILQAREQAPDGGIAGALLERAQWVGGFGRCRALRLPLRLIC